MPDKRPSGETADVLQIVMLNILTRPVAVNQEMRFRFGRVNLRPDARFPGRIGASVKHFRAFVSVDRLRRLGAEGVFVDGGHGAMTL